MATKLSSSPSRIEQFASEYNQTGGRVRSPGPAQEDAVQKPTNPTKSTSRIDLYANEYKEAEAKEGAREPRGAKALTRGIIEGGLGTYGNVSSLLHGGEEDRVTPGEKARLAPEVEALKKGDDKEFERQILANAASESDLAPTLTRAATSQDVDKMLTMMGIEKQEKKPEERALGRIGRLGGGAAVIPGVGVPLAASTAVTGGLAGHAAEELGFGPTGQAVAETIGSLRPFKLPSAPATAIRQPRVVTKGIPPGRAGEIIQYRLGSQLNRVNEEAGNLGRNIGLNNRPFQTASRAIEANVPIQENFNKFFKEMENITYKFNSPLKDVSPLEKFIDNESRLYQGTGAKTFLGDLVTKELQGWQKSGQNGLYNLFRRYRLNNQRIKEISSDPDFPRAFRDQAISFFSRMNDSIGQSFSSSLPKNSRWLQAFTESNDAYSSYINTLQARRVLQPLIEGNLTPGALTRHLGNERLWENLNRFLGPEESQNLRTLLTDLQTARNGLLSMRQAPSLITSIVKHFVGRSFGKLAGTIVDLPAGWRLARGLYYSAPEFSHTFSELAQAIADKNIPAIVTAANKIEEYQDRAKSQKKTR